ncbi:hypothetical protein [Methylobacter marinus]|uniref:hypothetical protein n=1 Tax=Methylobacter marinus TaxID=34058 RepID=UPI0003A532DA|nr:hypothetical protein [Methylobacter marinus]
MYKNQFFAISPHEAAYFGENAESLLYKFYKTDSFMALEPEARKIIDQLLTAAGWVI